MRAPTGGGDGDAVLAARGCVVSHDLAPIDIGTCTDVEAHDPITEDGVQHSTNGVLVWRKADDRLVFTNGAWTWILGPRGLAHRQNNERFAWESNPEGFSIVAGGS